MIIDVVSIENQIVQNDLVLNAEWFFGAFVGLVIVTVFWSVFFNRKEFKKKRKLNSELCH